MGVDYDHMVLRNITEDLGRPVADLIIEKKREVEKYCPSGCYPTEVGAVRPASPAVNCCQTSCDRSCGGVLRVLAGPVRG